LPYTTDLKNFGENFLGGCEASPQRGRHGVGDEINITGVEPSASADGSRRWFVLELRADPFADANGADRVPIFRID
jgi:hypothetical protein